MSNVQTICKSLIENGFQVIMVDHAQKLVIAVGNDGENVWVSEGGAGYCKVQVDNFICTNMAQPYNVGEAARLKRHVAMFENVTMDTKA